MLADCSSLRLGRVKPPSQLGAGGLRLRTPRPALGFGKPSDPGGLDNSRIPGRLRRVPFRLQDSSERLVLIPPPAKAFPGWEGRWPRHASARPGRSAHPGARWPGRLMAAEYPGTKFSSALQTFRWAISLCISESCEHKTLWGGSRLGRRNRALQNSGTFRSAGFHRLCGRRATQPGAGRGGVAGGAAPGCCNRSRTPRAGRHGRREPAGAGWGGVDRPPGGAGRSGAGGAPESPAARALWPKGDPSPSLAGTNRPLPAEGRDGPAAPAGSPRPGCKAGRGRGVPTPYPDT